jgi:protein gp37
MSKTKIEWTEATWNPVTGCTKVSAGCKFCYAKTLHDQRHKAFLEGKDVPSCYATPFETVVCHPDRLKIPLRRRKPTMYFVNSMSDLFHEDIAIDFIEDIFGIMNQCDQHIFQVLTKRPNHLLGLQDAFSWTKNIWMGVSVENKDALWRLRCLQERLTYAKVKFLSIEPLLEDLGEIDLTGIDWVIVGGESGITPRPMQESWVRNIKDQCVAQDVPFFYKQSGGTRANNIKLPFLDGQQWTQYPKSYQK